MTFAERWSTNIRFARVGRSPVGDWPSGPVVSRMKDDDRLKARVAQLGPAMLWKRGERGTRNVEGDERTWRQRSSGERV
jgi:hypothetical protein